MRSIAVGPAPAAASRLVGRLAVWLSRSNLAAESAASSKRSRYSSSFGSWLQPTAQGRLDQRRPEARRAAATSRDALARLRVPAPRGVVKGALVAHESELSRCHAYSFKLAPPPMAVHKVNVSGTLLGKGR
jgi:hypothetical protein